MCYLIAIPPLTATFIVFVKLHFFHLKNISKLRPMLSMSNAEMLICAFMTSRLDYCNAVLGGCSACLINKLQMVQNAATRVLTRTRNYDYISPVMSTLHWLPIKHRIDQCFSNFLHQVPPQKIFGFPSTTIMTNIKMQYKWLPTAPGVCSRCVCVCVCSLLCVCALWMG